MALFSRKQKKEEQAAPKTETKAVAVQQASGLRASLSHILKHARITEKASHVTGGSVYVFDIAQRASKRDVMYAVKELYNVSPRKVSVVSIPKKTKRNMRSGRSGVRGGGKKAYVYLKQGETITIS